MVGLTRGVYLIDGKTVLEALEGNDFSRESALTYTGRIPPRPLLGQKKPVVTSGISSRNLFKLDASLPSLKTDVPLSL